jgi:hypothetical protein
MPNTLPPIPESTPIDPSTGDWRPEWKRWLRRLYDIVKEL